MVNDPIWYYCILKWVSNINNAMVMWVTLSLKTVEFRWNILHIHDDVLLAINKIHKLYNITKFPRACGIFGIPK